MCVICEIHVSIVMPISTFKIKCCCGSYICANVCVLIYCMYSLLVKWPSKPLIELTLCKAIYLLIYNGPFLHSGYVHVYLTI